MSKANPDKPKRPVGSPPYYTNVEDMQKKIDQYFAKSEGEMLLDKEGDPILNKGYPIYIKSYPLTITGLALALGFTSRQALLNYQDKKEFVDTLTRAKLVVEEYANTRLFDKDGVQGAKFSLSNNYEGYKEKTETDLNIKEIPQIIFKRAEKE